ncbi:hypothetical protein WBG99_20075 [Streptomyces sp. TG1A-60]|uniref:hypothetical protein n=1 Tax=Streptomyces sp. TG1A-60 TaxID=3129111 RepID=UPI0030CF8620
MTQSGQGEEPSARTAREGIVLPSDGGAPLLPSDLPTDPVQPWERRWGPEGTAAPALPHTDQWGGAPNPEWGGQGTHDAYGAQGVQGGYGPQGAWDGQDGQGARDGQRGMPLPPEGAQGPSYGVEGYGGAGSGAPLPPVAAPQSPQSAPLPPMDEAATQYIPPVPQAGAVPMDEGATQFLPPVAPQAPAAEAATQFLPPVGPGALPPEASAAATTYLPRVPDNGAMPLPPAGNPDAEATQYIPPVEGQPQPYGAPQRAQQQPDVFDSLFRSESGAGTGGAAGATQQLPKIEHPSAARAPQGPGHGGHAGHGGHGGRASARRESGGGGGRTGSRVPLIAALGVGIAVLGIGAGALMSGSGSDRSQDDNKPVSATGAAPRESAPPSADPAKEQAVALDKLLADSGDSRSSVIKAVANIKTCTNLGQAATDLRDAAAQRNDLVTRLGELSVDKLPDNVALTTALTKAWKASASADNHYAAWADQAAGKKGCRKGQARTTGQTQAGNAASGTASAEKAKAAELWNVIATTYGLTERQAVQL